MSPMLTALAVLRGRRFSLEDEKRTQAEIAKVLLHTPYQWAREVPVAGGIIDFTFTILGTVGIEVKLKGQPAAIVRQLSNYAEDPRLEGLILVTAKAVPVPPKLAGKPVHVLDLGRAWL